jgi:hypothetical protein
MMYVFGIKKNLISISTINDNNLIVEFGKLRCVLKDIDGLFPLGTRVGVLYKLDVTMNCHVALTLITMST